MSATLLPYVPGVPIPSPAYVDANIIVAAKMRGHPLYAPSRRLLAGVLQQRGEIILSALVIDEVWWALLRGWYFEGHGVRLFNRDVTPGAQVITPYASRFRSLQRQLRLWPRLRLASPDVQASWEVISRSLEYMVTCHVTPRDAFHLAAAEVAGAASFLTADADFDHLPGLRLQWDVTIVTISAP